MKWILICLLCLPGSLGCSSEHWGEGAANFVYFAEEGEVTIIAGDAGAECIYDKGPICSVGGERVRVSIEGAEYLDVLRTLGSREAMFEYNSVDKPRYGFCELPTGSIYLAQFYIHYGTVEGTESDQPTITMDDQLQPERGEFIRLPPDSIEQSPYAQQARQYIFDMMSQCEEKGAPQWRP